MASSFIPIYKQVAEFYRKKIFEQEYLPGSRIDSISKIMQRHNIGRETGKLVLKTLINEGLVISVIGKGSFVAPVQKVKKLWGLIIPFYSSNIEQLISYLNDEAESRGRRLEHLLAYNNPEEEKRLVGKMIREGYEAIIVIPNYDETQTSDFYRSLFSGNTRIILIDNTMAGSYFHYVIQSYDLGIKRALEYLTSKTDKNLLLVKNNAWKGRNLLYELIEKTFTTRIQSDFKNYKPVIISSLNEFSKQLIDKNNIGGILSCVDTDSLKILARIKKWGYLIPDEISLISYGNTELTKCIDPPITVLDCQYKEMAKKTAILIEKDTFKGSLEQHIINQNIIIRKT